jgi:hypothetical protein
MDCIGTPFSHKYLKFNFYFEKFKLGTMKLPKIVLVIRGTAFLSFAEDTFKMYCSVISPFFNERALN